MTQSIEDACGKAPLQDTPETLRVNLKGWRDQVEVFRKTLDVFNQFDLKRRDAPSQIAANFKADVEKLKNELYLMEPSDSTGFQTIQTDIGTAMGKLDLAIKEALSTSKGIVGKDHLNDAGQTMQS